jgi:hypothetical protein
MPMLTPETRFDLVHVGKCGGSSVVEELRHRGFAFEHIHMRRPRPVVGRRYVVLVRDPVARFVSAFNWRYHLLAGDLLPAARVQDPIARMRHRTELEFLTQFDSVNEFAERLVRHGEHEVSALTTLMHLIGHVPQGFAWYLDELLGRIEPRQLAGVIATERLPDDFEALFGFRPSAARNRLDASRSTALSPQGRAHLAREFSAEYRTLGRLAELACRAGIKVSMTYDPERGAVPA